MEQAPLPPLLVALGSDPRAQRLVHAAFWRAREAGRPWIAVHVQLPGEAEEAADLDQARLWMEECRSLGAELLHLPARTLSAGLQEAQRRTGATEIVLGRGRSSWPLDRLGHSTAQELARRLPEVRIHALELEPGQPRSAFLPPPGRRLGTLFGAAAILAGCTGLAAILPPGASLPAIFLIFLAGTATIARKWGRAAGLLAAAAALPLFRALPPELGTAPWPVVLLFAVILAGGQGAADLARRLEGQTRAVRHRAALLNALLLLGRHLASALDARDVARALTRLGERLLHRPIELLHFRNEAWVLEGEDGEHPLPPKEAPPAALAAGPPAPGSPEPLVDGQQAWIALGGGPSLEGALRIRLRRPSELDGELRELLGACAVQVALALERVRWLEAARLAQLEGETERMRSSLLGAVSHDLRTPLAAIQGAASTLLLEEDGKAGALDAATRRELLATIHEESRRLTRLLGNLLELTRLESGPLRASKEWHPLDELLASALRRAEQGQAPLDLRLELPEDLPLVPVDGPLLENLVLNLLENARRHAPGSPVRVRAWTLPERLELEISDQGPGIPPELRERVFEKFVRLPGSPREGGAGLGLAICDAVARAHGGSIRVEEAPGGGAAFRVSLPLEGAPPAAPAEGEP